MKNLILTVAVAALATTSVMGQTRDLKKDLDGYKNKVAASDKVIQDPKKSASVKVWEDRGALLLEASKVNAKNIYAGMEAAKTATNPFACAEYFIGAPTEKRSAGDGMEIWVYPTIDFYVDVEKNTIQYWKITEPATENILDKAAEAYRKACDLYVPKNDKDPGYKAKKSTQEAIKPLREAFFNSGINNYYLKDYEAAAHDFEGALALSEFPRCASDTIILDGQIAYNAGLCGYQSGKKDDATINYFVKAADLDYQPGSSYHYIYQIYTDQNKEDLAFKTISEAYKKFPKEEQILYDVINYYLGKKQNKEAEEYLNTAIADHPDNLILYNVKANIFVQEYTALKDQYDKDLEKVSQLKKEAFRQRNNPQEKARVEGELAKAQEDADNTKAKYMENQKKAIECGNDALKVKADDYNSLFMLAMIAYDEADLIAIEKDKIPFSEDKDGSKAAAKEEAIKQCWKKSCEYFEKSHEADLTQKNPLANLKILYYKLGDTENNKRVKDILDQMD